MPCTVVVRDEAVGAAVAASLDPNTGTYEQRMFYVLAHEAGHCRDVANRPGALDKTLPLTPQDGKFRVSHMAERHWTILIDEFFACYFAAPAMVQAVFDDEEKDIQQRIIGIKQDLDQVVASRDSNRTIALWASQLFWVILLEYSKLIGHFAGNKSLQRRIGIWLDAPSNTTDILLKLLSMLESLPSCYPKIDPSVRDQLVAHWRAVATSFGYSFVESAEEDKVVVPV